MGFCNNITGKLSSQCFDRILIWIQLIGCCYQLKRIFIFCKILKLV